jgi:uncharacterized protein YqeY
MSLQKQIREDMVAAMKTRDNEVRDFLRVVAGEFGRKMDNGIELSDDEVITILKRMKKDAIIMENLNEVEILEKYLPQMLTEEQIRLAVNSTINTMGYSGMKDMGAVMKEIKNFGTSDRIDMKLANTIVRELLS